MFLTVCARGCLYMCVVFVCLCVTGLLSFHQIDSITHKMHQIGFQPGLCPRPRWGAHHAPPDLLNPYSPAGRGIPHPHPRTASRPERLSPPPATHLHFSHCIYDPVIFLASSASKCFRSSAELCNVYTAGCGDDD